MHESKRIQRENKTVAAMIQLYCRARHQTSHLCESCQQLAHYTRKRNAFCPFADKKPVCNRCQVHCYSPKYRQQIKKIMRYAGPRMLYHHPWLALRHMIDGWRKIPTLPNKITQIKR